MAVVLGGLLFSKYAFAAVALIVELAMLEEFYGMTLAGAHRPQKIVTMVAGALLFVLVFAFRAFCLPVTVLSASVAVPISVMAAMLFSHKKEDFALTAFLLAGLVYIAVPVSIALFLTIDGSGNFNGILMLCFFIIVWASDIGAYCIGMLFGRNGKKLSPKVSPGKSWAGFWGGFVAAEAAAILLSVTGLLDISVLIAAILAAIMHVTGVAGDLFESMWKRTYGLKDSGNLIPGHGGMLDRLDSSLFAMPAGAAFLYIVGLM